MSFVQNSGEKEMSKAEGMEQAEGRGEVQVGTASSGHRPEVLWGC